MCKEFYVSRPNKKEPVCILTYVTCHIQYMYILYVQGCMYTFLLVRWFYRTQNQPQACDNWGISLPRLGTANERERIFNEIHEGRE